MGYRSLILYWCCGCALALAGSVFAHTDMIGPLVRVEKVYDAPAPIGRITVKFDATNADAATLELTSALFRASLPPNALRNLPRPNWDGLAVPYSLTSYDVETRQWVNRPYLYITLPVYGPAGRTWPSTSVQFSFDEKGGLKERRLKQHVPVKDGRPRPDLPPADTDFLHTLYEPWPVEGTESAEEVLSRALRRHYPATQPADK
jgi:hypothetical protein